MCVSIYIYIYIFIHIHMDFLLNLCSRTTQFQEQRQVFFSLFLLSHSNAAPGERTHMRATAWIPYISTNDWETGTQEWQELPSSPQLLSG